MSPRHLIPMTVVAALAAGAVTAVAIDDNTDKPSTIAITGTVAEPADPVNARLELSGVTLLNDTIVSATRPSLDTLLPNGRKLTFNVTSRPAEITGRIDARP